MKYRIILSGILAIMVLSMSVNAAQLGVNYYHESMMGGWGTYTPRTPAEVGQDLDQIKTISNHLKIYMNPFVEKNLEWNKQIAALAKQRSMHIVVNMMVDNTQLDNNNWQQYSDSIAASCQALSGKVDGILVGNEITLHSPMSRTEIRDKVIALMNRCEESFPGEVSYEEFWFANDVWAGYEGKIHFMMYENLDSFRNNMQELDAKFGANGIIGEWGEDLRDENVERDDWWQREQIQKRWDIIQQTKTPVAYLFTYSEPSWNAFGMMRPDGVKRPLWEVFGAAPTPKPLPSTKPPVAQPPIVQPTTQSSPVLTLTPTQPKPGSTFAQSAAISRLPLTCAATTICSVEKDVTDGDCRTVAFKTNGIRIQILGCDQGTETEIYVQDSTGKFTVCFGNACVNQDSGFVRVTH